MIYLIRISIRDGRARQGLLWLLLLSVSFALTGFISAPSRYVPTDERAERFPCENCACGCSSAEYCWDKCCCHTDQEKLEWAERHGVTPPDFLITRVSENNQPTSCSIQRVCCHCAKQPTTVSEVASPEELAEGDPAERQAATAILLWKAAECQGIQYLWTMLAAAYVSPSYTVYRIDPAFSGWIVFFDEHARSHLTAPDPPIP